MDTFINAINNLITNLSTEFIPISNLALRVSTGTLIISLLNVIF
jgi:hypothetical protein